MTTEKFEQACEIKQNIDNAVEVESLFKNFKTLHCTLEIRLKRDNSKALSKVDTMPTDLLNTIIQGCREYIENQQNEFKNL